MTNTHFFWGYLPFWIVNYGLAIVAWSCLGRFLLAFFVPSLQPTNYIWRAFVVLTEWAVVMSSYVTPSYVRPIYLAPIAAFWVFHLRFIAYFAMAAVGLTPSLSAGG
jgi:hypothetical protein